MRGRGQSCLKGEYRRELMAGEDSERCGKKDERNENWEEQDEVQLKEKLWCWEQGET